MTDQPRKLIEVALPLDEINAACKAEKAVKTGTIRNMHKWFAPMPLPAWRALLYAALIDDPDDDEKRAYHLDVIKRLVSSGGSLPDESILKEARDNIQRQFPEGPPPVMDPFCGGGSTLVEAQRLGLRTAASDLNPVPVLITRTLSELLPQTWGVQPLHPEVASSIRRTPRDSSSEQGEFGLGGEAMRRYSGFDGIARDVTHYAEWVLKDAWDRVHESYPLVPGEAPIAWLWARTVRCPNPACGIETVLTTSWWLSKKSGDLAWIEPKVTGGDVVLEIKSGQPHGEPPQAPKSGRGASFVCLGCGGVVSTEYVREEGLSGRIGFRMTAVVSERDGGRLYRRPTEAEVVAATVLDVDRRGLDVPIGNDSRSMWCVLYGVDTWDKLYTERQLLTLSALSDSVSQVKAQVLRDGGSEEWATTVATLLGLCVGQVSRYSSTQTFLYTRNGPSAAKAAFSRNDVPMTWDFVETATFGNSIGGWMTIVGTTLLGVSFAARGEGVARKIDARVARFPDSWPRGLVATDPPYFDAIGYADLSDYFYIWHRKALRDVHPDLYQTLATPKSGELTALPTHHGNSKELARRYFIEGFTETFRNLTDSLAPDLPLLVVYASKEQKGGAEEETRWSSILTAMVEAELEISGSWPIHGTTENRMISAGTNAVATYVVMVCRPRAKSAPSTSMQDFNRALRRELKLAVHDLQAAGILPVDLAQAAMGPGMQVYSRYRSVLDQAGERVPVDMALRLINQALAEVLDEQEGELDPDSRFAVTWWEKHHWSQASFGEADQLARPKGISVDDVIRAGVAAYPKPGFVQVVGELGLDREWSPADDSRPTAWEAVHHLADRLIDGGGVAEAGELMGQLGGLRDQAQGLVYRLHAIAVRRGWTKDQERYNALIGSWSDLLAEAGRSHSAGDGLF